MFQVGSLANYPHRGGKIVNQFPICRRVIRSGYRWGVRTLPLSRGSSFHTPSQEKDLYTYISKHPSEANYLITCEYGSIKIDCPFGILNYPIPSQYGSILIDGSFGIFYYMVHYPYFSGYQDHFKVRIK